MSQNKQNTCKGRSVLHVKGPLLPPTPALVSPCRGLPGRFWSDLGSLFLPGDVLQLLCVQIGSDAASFCALVGRGSWFSFCCPVCWERSRAATSPSPLISSCEPGGGRHEKMGLLPCPGFTAHGENGGPHPCPQHQRSSLCGVGNTWASALCFWFVDFDVSRGLFILFSPCQMNGF